MAPITLKESVGVPSNFRYTRPTQPKLIAHRLDRAFYLRIHDFLVGNRTYNMTIRDKNGPVWASC